MALASAGTRKSGSSAQSTVWILHSMNSEQPCQEFEHGTDVREEELFSSCFGRSIKSLFTNPTPEKRHDPSNCLSWQCAGASEPTDVGDPGGEFDENTQPIVVGNSLASPNECCGKSFSQPDLLHWHQQKEHPGGLERGTADQTPIMTAARAPSPHSTTQETSLVSVLCIERRGTRRYVKAYVKKVEAERDVYKPQWYSLEEFQNFYGANDAIRDLCEP